MPRHEGDYYNEIRPARFVTPHLKFARPLRGGPVRVLFIVPGPVARDVAELWQRVEVVFESVTVMDAETLGWTHPIHTAVKGLTVAEKRRELNRKLDAQYDVICLLDVSLDKLPAEAQFEILRQVRAGTGLMGVFRNTRSQKDIYGPVEASGSDVLRDAPLEGLPYFRGDRWFRMGEDHDRTEVENRVLRTARFGRGRIAWLNYAAAHNRNHFYQGDALGRPAVNTPGVPRVTSHAYDAALSLAGRALLWVARRRPDVRIDVGVEDGSVFQRDEWPGSVTARLTAIHGEAPESITVEARLARPSGDYAAHAEKTVARTGKTTDFSIYLGAPPDGPAFLWLIARDGEGRVLDWSVVSITVESSLHFAGAALETDAVDPGEAVALDVEFSEVAGKNARVEMGAVDVHGRLFWRDEFPAADELSVSVPTGAARGRSGSVLLRLFSGNELLDVERVEFFVRRRFGHRFIRLIWAHPGLGRKQINRGYLMDLRAGQLRRAGWNAGMIFGRDSVRAGARALARANAGTFDYASHVKGGHFYNFFDPDYREKNLAGLRERARNARSLPPFACSLGDENGFSVRDDLDEHQLTSYRGFLQREYGGDIRELNRYWHSDFDGIDGVTVGPRDGAEWTLTRRYDLRAFWDWAYAWAHHRKAAALREGDPNARVGAEGSQPGNLWQTISGLDWWAPYYNRYVNTQLRFWMDPAALRANWWGGYTVGGGGGRRGPTILRRQIVTGSVNASFWFIGRVGPEGAVSADLSYADHVESWLPVLGRIQANEGPLLKAARPVDDGLGIYWSRLSTHVNTLDGRFGSGKAGQKELLSHFDRLGLNAKFISDYEIADGNLDPESTPILFLCVTKAIRDEVAEQLHRYVEDGGLLVADVAPDIRDRRGAEVEPGRLLELFGAESESASPVEKKISFAGVEFRGARLALNTGQCAVDDSIRTDGGRALARVGEVPLLIRRSVGRGTALLLNFSLYDALAQAEDAGPVTTPAGDFLLDLLGAAEVRPAFDPLPGLPWNSVRTFRHADAFLVGLHRWAGQAGEKAFRAGSKFRLHTFRPGFPDRKIGEVRFPDENAENILVAVLPREERELVLRGATAGRRGERLTFTAGLSVGGEPLGGSLLRFDVYGPDGSLREACRQFKLSTPGGVRFEWPVALNADAATCEVRVTEIVSGRSESAEVRVQGAR